MVGYLSDSRVQQEYNLKKQNCWEVYSEELLSLAGVGRMRLSLEDMENPQVLDGCNAIILGRQSGPLLSETAKQALRSWVDKGGILLGFATGPVLDDVFRIRHLREIKQTPDPYSLNAKMEYWNHPLVRGLRNMLFREQKLLIFSDVWEIQQCDNFSFEEVALLYGQDGEETGYPAVTWAPYGKGHAAYFAFDPAQTVWILHQGRPISLEPQPMQYCKTGLMSVVGENSTKVPYADELVFLIQNIVSQVPQPSVYQMPPDRRGVPDGLFYWSGDEYFGPASVSLEASDWMRQHGLPYHINWAVEKNWGRGDGHPGSEEARRHICEENAHEIGLWYNSFCDLEKSYTLSEEVLRRQLELFKEKYGQYPVSTLMNNTNWVGWAEPARWQERETPGADNSFACMRERNGHPLSNSASYGFSRGTAFPFFFYDDYTQNNRKIRIIEQCVSCYEIGHRGSTTFDGEECDVFEPGETHLPIDVAARFHQVLNLFYHPYYVVDYPYCRRAIEEILRYINDMGYLFLQMGADELCRWWFERDACRIGKAETLPDGSVRFSINCAREEGILLRYFAAGMKASPYETGLNGQETPIFFCDGEEIPCQLRRETMGYWAYVKAPYGEHTIEVSPRATGLVNKT